MRPPNAPSAGRSTLPPNTEPTTSCSGKRTVTESPSACWRLRSSSPANRPASCWSSRISPSAYPWRGSCARPRKLEAVGQLTGGVAHDFNNLLQVVAANLELSEERLPDDHKVQPLLENARQAVRRGGNLTRKLLAFSRKQALRPGSLRPLQAGRRHAKHADPYPRRGHRYRDQMRGAVGHHHGRYP